MYYAGIDPFTKKPVTVAKGMCARKMQRALKQCFKPENWFTVREALLEAKRNDLIGDGCDCLISANPPREVLEKRRRDAQRAVEGNHCHTVPNPANGENPGERGVGPVKTGYRPGRKTQKRRQGKKSS